MTYLNNSSFELYPVADTPINDLLWNADTQYGPGAFAEVQVLSQLKKFHCKQEPFADFCSQFSPSSGRGAMAW